jgi:hypothetical protein
MRLPVRHEDTVRPAHVTNDGAAVGGALRARKPNYTQRHESGKLAFMAADKPEPAPKARVTAELDELMATVLRHLRTGHGDPLEELGLDKAADELQHWRPDIPGSGAADIPDP